MSATHTSLAMLSPATHQMPQLSVGGGGGGGACAAHAPRRRLHARGGRPSLIAPRLSPGYKGCDCASLRPAWKSSSYETVPGDEAHRLEWHGMLRHCER